MPVVIAASAGGTLIHEAIGHSLEADLVQEGTSPAFQGKLGTRVAADNVTVIEGPKIKEPTPSAGTAATAVALVVAGAAGVALRHRRRGGDHQ